MHRLVAILALVAHVAFVAFTIIGGLIAWLLPWVLVPHILSALWGARMALLPRTCPLSTAENWGRRGSGRPMLHDGGFIAHYCEGRLYPRAWGRQVTYVVGTLILGSWFGFALR